MKEFRLPDLGEGLAEAEIVEWHVAPGDEVVSGQTLVSVETDKAVVDIPAPERGRVATIHGSKGDRIAIGDVLVEFAAEGAADAGALVGRLPGREAPAARKPAQFSKPAAPPAARVKAMPAVRALAERLGIDLATVGPTGPEGQVTSVDLERAAKTGAVVEGGEPLRGVRRAMAANMARAHAEVAPATAMDQADVSSWWTKESDVTLRLVRAVAAGCAASPALNAWYDSRRGTRRLHERLDLGIAMDTEDGLFVPVLRDAGRTDATRLRAELERLKEAVRTRRIASGELRGQTISLSNFGTLGGRHAALVVIPPQVAILGAGRVAPGVVPTPDGHAIRPTLPLSLTFDHRVVTGGEAARFLAAALADLMLAK
jgi:2-oxoisovalerate dehydrogenase E2 component (dihydrolipoyl transacylase)